MRNLFLISVLSLLGFQVQGRFILVNNNVNAIDQFRDLTTAYNAALEGDTIYLVPSPTSYGNLTIMKRITLLGVGLKDKNGNVLTVFSQTGNISVDTSGTNVRTSGTIISGVYITINSGTTLSLISSSLKNVLFFNCFITLYYGGLGIGDNSSNFFDNIIQASNLNIGKNVLFRNNVVTGGIRGGINCNITNNIFLGATPVSNFTNSAFSNNIFYSNAGAVNTTTPGIGNSYSNNVQGGTDLGPGNLTGVNMTTVFQESAVGSTTATALIGLSFLIKAGSPALTYGIGNTETGVYGGDYPWPKGAVYTRSPGVLPVVTSILVQNQTVKPGGTLKFSFKAKSLK